jgi:hypothetical protein
MYMVSLAARAGWIALRWFGWMLLLTQAQAQTSEEITLGPLLHRADCDAGSPHNALTFEECEAYVKSQGDYFRHTCCGQPWVYNYPKTTLPHGCFRFNGGTGSGSDYNFRYFYNPWNYNQPTCEQSLRPQSSTPPHRLPHLDRTCVPCAIYVPT